MFLEHEPRLVVACVTFLVRQCRHEFVFDVQQQWFFLLELLGQHMGFVLSQTTTKEGREYVFREPREDLVNFVHGAQYHARVLLQ